MNQRHGGSFHREMIMNYKSEACAVVHDLMSGLCEDGLIDEEAMREFDELCLEPSPPLTPEELVKIRDSISE
jgi:putative transcriptional regulator